MKFYEFLAQMTDYISTPYTNITVFAQELLPALALVFALLICFLGYRLHRVWLTLLFAFVGFWGGTLLSTLFPVVNASVFVWIGLVIAVGIGFLSNKFYRAGVFSYNAGLVFSLVYDLTSALLPLWACTLLGLAFGIVAGVLALRFRQSVTIAVTCVCGAFTAAPMLLRLSGGGQGLFYTLAFLLAIAGAAVQLALAGTPFGGKRRRR